MLLGTILISAILSAVIANLVLNQARFTQHQVNRVKAYYACLAAMNLAMENLRTGSWGTTSGSPYSLCASGCTVDDPDMPYRVNITISDPDPVTQIRTINCTANYTYTP